jgi:hypothetical protein
MATGDGGASAPGVWLPSTGMVTRLDGLGYTGAADAHGGRALLLDDTCADLVTMNDQGQITGEGSSPLDPECATQQWQIGPAPTGQVVGFGVAGHAVPLLVLDGTGATHVSTERVVDAVWHGSGAVTAIADNGELMTCAVSATCQAVRPLGRPPVDLGRWWLIPD